MSTNNTPVKSSLHHFAPHVARLVDGPIRVRAVMKGFYNNTLRHPGDEFGIHTEEEFAPWMEKVTIKPDAAEEIDDLDDLDDLDDEKPKGGKKRTGGKSGKSGKQSGEDDVL